MLFSVAPCLLSVVAIHLLAFQAEQLLPRPLNIERNCLLACKVIDGMEIGQRSTPNVRRVRFKLPRVTLPSPVVLSRRQLPVLCQDTAQLRPCIDLPTYHLAAILFSDNAEIPLSVRDL